MEGDGLAIGVAAAFCGLAALGRRGSRAFLPSNVDRSDKGPPKWEFSVRYGIYLEPVSVDDTPHQMQAVEFGFVDDWNEVLIGVTEGGNQADLMAMNPYHVVHPTEAGIPLVRTCRKRSQMSVMSELGVSGEAYRRHRMPEPLLLFLDMWGRTRDFRIRFHGGALPPPLYGEAQGETTPHSWTSRLSPSPDVDAALGAEWIAYTIVLEPMERVVLGGRRVVKHWPAWAIPLFDALSRCAHSGRKAQAVEATRRVQDLVAAIVGTPVDSLYPSRVIGLGSVPVPARRRRR